MRRTSTYLRAAVQAGDGDPEWTPSTTENGSSFQRVDVPVGAAEVERSAADDRRRPDRTDREHAVEREDHVLVVAEIRRIDHVVVESAVGFQDFQRVGFRRI